jgi:Phosphatidylethanolamine-binding protein
MNKQAPLLVSIVLFVLLGMPRLASARELEYGCSEPPIEVTFAVQDGHYSGAVNCGNLFLQSDIPTAPVVRWKGADATRLYTLVMLDFDGNANGSWPDPVAPGENATVRHWIVGNIPGDLLRGRGYMESGSDSGIKTMSVLQPYRAPHIPVVSDRYGIYLFEQPRRIDFAAVTGPITNFDYSTFLDTHHLGDPKASNFFVAIYTSESPFSGKPFHGNDVSGVWHQGYGKGKLAPSQQ